MRLGDIQAFAHGSLRRKWKKKLQHESVEMSRIQILKVLKIKHKISWTADVLRSWNSCDIDREKRKRTDEWKGKIRPQVIVNFEKR